jgi:hypothetical protein
MKHSKNYLSMKKIEEIVQELLEFAERIIFWLRNRCRIIHA